jgi:hypothetical protein
VGIIKSKMVNSKKKRKGKRKRSNIGLLRSRAQQEGECSVPQRLSLGIFKMRLKSTTVKNLEKGPTLAVHGRKKSRSSLRFWVGPMCCGPLRSELRNNRLSDPKPTKVKRDCVRFLPPYQIPPPRKAPYPTHH